MRSLLSVVAGSPGGGDARAPERSVSGLSALCRSPAKSPAIHPADRGRRHRVGRAPRFSSKTRRRGPVGSRPMRPIKLRATVGIRPAPRRSRVPYRRAAAGAHQTPDLVPPPPVVGPHHRPLGHHTHRVGTDGRNLAKGVTRHETAESRRADHRLQPAGRTAGPAVPGWSHLVVLATGGSPRRSPPEVARGERWMPVSGRGQLPVTGVRTARPPGPRPPADPAVRRPSPLGHDP